MEKIPVCDIWLNGNERRYVDDCMATGWISSSGAYVTRFETAFAAYCGCKHGIAVCNGTVALHLALAALGVGRGDEVILPDFTMIASAFAVCYTGAKPVFVDADPATFNIDVSKIEAKITPRTKAIMPVHIFGNPCDMGAIAALARAHNLAIVEDAAEAHGATYQGRKTGSFSAVAAFSFFANKNLTTGEGGMAVTNDDALAERCRYFKNVCFPTKGPRTYRHDDIGFNYRMSNLHAAIGLAQVEKADFYREKRMAHRALYQKGLADCAGIVLQADTAGAVNVGWMNAVVVDSAVYGRTRDELIARLKENGVDTRLLFCGMHRQKALLDFGCDGSGDYPATDRLTENGFYLPSGSNLTEAQIERVCGIIADFKR